LDSLFRHPTNLLKLLDRELVVIRAANRIVIRSYPSKAAVVVLGGPVAVLPASGAFLVLVF